MRVVLRPVARAPQNRVRRPWRAWPKVFVEGVVGTCLLVVLIPNVHLTPSRPRATAHAAPRSWIAHTTLLTVYGRALGTAPILGRLGEDRDMADVARQLEPTRRAIAENTGGRPVRFAIHLIYGLATPCAAAPSCLLYLDDTGTDLVKQYIEPAARRGWLVILDDQLGSSTPRAEIQRMIARGYLAHDNVEVAFDPEFRTTPGQSVPGIPTGYVTASELTDAQSRLGAYNRLQHLRHRKLLLVHQWTPGMIRRSNRLKSSTSNVQTVIVMDGIGAPADKTQAYRQLLNSAVHRALVPGIKIFPPNPYDSSSHVDSPALGWGQVFGRIPAQDDQGVPYFMHPLPRVVVMT